MYCKKCGKQIDNDSVFCSFCGTKQSDSVDLRNQQSTDNEIKSEELITPKTLNINFSFGRHRKERLIKRNEVIKEKYEKFDYSFPKDYIAVIFGVVLIIGIIITFTVGGIRNEEIYTILSVILIIVRIIIVVYSVNRAEKLNRNKTGWGFLGFFFPAISLILIGLLPKIRIEHKKKIDQNIYNKNNGIQLTASNGLQTTIRKTKKELPRFLKFIIYIALLFLTITVIFWILSIWNVIYFEDSFRKLLSSSVIIILSILTIWFIQLIKK